jgi:putative RNA 2'-phosphotransferase
MPDLKRLSKLLAVILRHEPEKFGIVLDEQGFAPTQTVWQAIQKHYKNSVTYDDFLAVVEAKHASKKRYEIQGDSVRAMYGHSTETPIVYEAMTPPEILYHGTTSLALESILKSGIQSQARQYVHLTDDVALAEEVGTRHKGQFVLLVVHALQAHTNGVEFYYPQPRHYLAKFVPKEFIKVQQ